MELDWELGVLLQGADKLISVFWKQDTSHILDAKAIGPKGFDALCELDIIIDGMDRGSRIGKGDLAFATVFLGGFDGRFEIPYIV